MNSISTHQRTAIIYGWVTKALSTGVLVGGCPSPKLARTHGQTHLPSPPKWQLSFRSICSQLRWRDISKNNHFSGTNKYTLLYLFVCFLWSWISISVPVPWDIRIHSLAGGVTDKTVPQKTAWMTYLQHIIRTMVALLWWEKFLLNCIIKLLAVFALDLQLWVVIGCSSYQQCMTSSLLTRGEGLIIFVEVVGCWNCNQSFQSAYRVGVFCVFF